jgi:serine/threonine protein kinase
MLDRLAAMSDLALAQGSLIAGRYRLEHHLGEGGMGTVWAAVHTVTRRSVAMKFLKEAVRERADLRQRFLREAATASALKHPNVVDVIDVFDLEDSSPVMVMELLRGETLGKKLARDERLSMEETAALLLPVASAVGAAHALGIVHRDLKPENLFLEPGDGELRVKVLDFGIAKLTAEQYVERGLSGLLTEAGALLGTPCYMAPEQASGEHPVDHRADVWSLGVILYECLSGTRPIEGENLAQVVARLMSAGIIPLERIAPELPHEVAALVMQMLSREPGRRPQSLLDVSKILSRYTHVRAPAFDPPSTSRRSATELSAGTAKVVTGRDVDPQGATLLSSPAVGSSVDIPRKPGKDRLLWVLAMGIIAASLVGLSLLGLFPTRPVISADAAKPSEPAQVVAASHPAPAQAPPVASSDPGAPESAPSVASAQARPPAPRAKPPQPRLAPPATKAKVTAPATKSKAEASDETLFSGRK